MFVFSSVFLGNKEWLISQNVRARGDPNRQFEYLPHL